MQDKIVDGNSLNFDMNQIEPQKPGKSFEFSLQNFSLKHPLNNNSVIESQKYEEQQINLDDFQGFQEKEEDSLHKITTDPRLGSFNSKSKPLTKNDLQDDFDHFQTPNNELNLEKNSKFDDHDVKKMQSEFDDFMTTPGANPLYTPAQMFNIEDFEENPSQTPHENNSPPQEKQELHNVKIETFQHEESEKEEAKNRKSVFRPDISQENQVIHISKRHRNSGFSVKRDLSQSKNHTEVMQENISLKVQNDQLSKSYNILLQEYQRLCQQQSNGNN